MIEVVNVAKSYGPDAALRNVSLQLADGEAVGIHGPSGSGKTTLLLVIAGLLAPDSGSVLFDGTEYTGPGYCAPPHQRGIGFVFQQGALWPHLSVEQNITFGISGSSRDARDRAMSLLVSAGMEQLARRRPGELSAGQQRRVALLRALAPRPRYLLMDEPLTNLDDELKLQMIEVVKAEVAAAGSSMLFVSHDRAEAAQLCTRFVRMEDGSLS